MQLIQDKILQDGKIFPGNVLKVDSFLNHQLDVEFLDQIGQELYRRFRDCGVTKILTIEASGIAIACLTARLFNVPALFAKKGKAKNLSDQVYSAEVRSYTHGTVNTIFVSKDYLSPEDNVLIVDDFLAKGQALLGLIEIVKASGARVAGAGIAIEKCFQGGGDIIRQSGIRVESLAMIESMDDDTIYFRG